MEHKMQKNIRITMDGRSFDFPIDMSLFTGLMAPMPASPRPMPQWIQSSDGRLVQPSQERLVQPSQERLVQSSHKRLEENFFRRIEQDLESYRKLGRDEEARVLAAIVALHRRVTRIEDYCDLSKCKELKKAEPKPAKPVKNLKVQAKKKASKKK